MNLGSVSRKRGPPVELRPHIIYVLLRFSEIPQETPISYLERKVFGEEQPLYRQEHS